jgi:hypothetical protein
VTDYGRGAAADRRRWLHKRLTEMADADELPTTVSSLYYDGEQAGQWPSDSEVRARGGKRTPRQNVSDDVQWLIERELVEADAVVDLTRRVFDHRLPTDLLDSTYQYAEAVELSPWPGAVPMLIVESRSLASALDGAAERYGVALAPLNGMSGRSFVHHEVVPCLYVESPVAYLGDWNPAGGDIRANINSQLGGRGWRGTWTLLAVTDDDAEHLPRIVKRDGRRTASDAEYESVEAEALGTTELRRCVTAWLDSLLPPGFTWEAHERRTGTQRAEVLAMLGGRQ